MQTPEDAKNPEVDIFSKLELILKSPEIDETDRKRLFLLVDELLQKTVKPTTSLPADQDNKPKEWTEKNLEKITILGREIDKDKLRDLGGIGTVSDINEKTLFDELETVLTKLKPKMQPTEYDSLHNKVEVEQFSFVIPTNDPKGKLEIISRYFSEDTDSNCNGVVILKFKFDDKEYIFERNIWLSRPTEKNPLPEHGISFSNAWGVINPDKDIFTNEDGSSAATNEGKLFSDNPYNKDLNKLFDLDFILEEMRKQV